METKNIFLLIVLLILPSACSELSHHEGVEPCLIYSYDKGVGEGSGAFYVRGESEVETCNKVISDES